MRSYDFISKTNDTCVTESKRFSNKCQVQHQSLAVNSTSQELVNKPRAVTLDNNLNLSCHSRIVILRRTEEDIIMTQGKLIICV